LLTLPEPRATPGTLLLAPRWQFPAGLHTMLGAVHVGSRTGHGREATVLVPLATMAGVAWLAPR